MKIQSDIVYPDETDRKIIEALREDPQTTNKLIASDIGLAESTVAQRIRSMSDNGIMKIVAQREVFSDDYTLMTFLDISVLENVDETAQKISEIEEVISVSRCLGSSNLIANLRVRDRYHLNNILTINLSKVPNIVSFKCLICLKIVKYRTGYGDLSSSLPPSAFKMDEGLDSEIVKLLIENGRYSNRNIARKLNISDTNVRKRVNRMYDSGQMRLGVVVNPAATGPKTTAIIRLSVSPEYLADSLAELDEDPATYFIANISGDHNIWVLAGSDNLLSLSYWYEGLTKKLKGLTQKKVTPIIHNYCHRYDLIRIG